MQNRLVEDKDAGSGSPNLEAIRQEAAALLAVAEKVGIHPGSSHDGDVYEEMGADFISVVSGSKMGMPKLGRSAMSGASTAANLYRDFSFGPGIAMPGETRRKGVDTSDLSARAEISGMLLQSEISGIRLDPGGIKSLTQRVREADETMQRLRKLERDGLEVPLDAQAQTGAVQVALRDGASSYRPGSRVAAPGARI